MFLRCLSDRTILNEIFVMPGIDILSIQILNNSYYI